MVRRAARFPKRPVTPPPKKEAGPGVPGAGLYLCRHYPARLKAEAKRHLEVAGVIVLARDLQEIRQVGRIRSDAVPVGVIEGVERLRAELEGHALANFEVFEQSQVPVLESRVVDHVANTVLMVERPFGGRAP